MAYLEIRIAQDGCRVSLDRDRLRIGRLAGNDIILRDPQISRQHAELRRMAGQWHILDLGSTNGLHIKGRRVREHALASGDLLLLAPDVSLRFQDGPAPPDALSTAGIVAFPASPPAAAQSAKPPPARPAAAAPAGAPAASPMFDMLRPRSPFADDEQPYFPPGMGMPAPPTHYHSQYAPRPAADSVASGAQQPPAAPRSPSQYDTLPAGGYPAPAGPMTSGNDGHDPFRRSGVSGPTDTNRATAGPSSALLHVCQTCGQLTAPDSVYCQSCHHSIARECVNCRLSLLPVQDRCPRCQTPNPMSVRRAHRAAGA